MNNKDLEKMLKEYNYTPEEIEQFKKLIKSPKKPKKFKLDAVGFELSSGLTMGKISVQENI